jgi:perosamine synthetase
LSNYLINQIKPYINSEDLFFLKKTIQSTYVTEGKYTNDFEKKIRDKVGSKYSVAVNNWTSGLFCAIKSLNLKDNDEIIIPNFTFIACATSAVLANLRVVLCDVKIDTLCIDLEKAEKLINKKTKAIMLVHMYGESCDIAKALELKKKYNIKIIEDAAQSFCGKYNNKYLGTYGDVGGYSFYGNKLITTGEGGVLITNNYRYYKKTVALKNYGRLKKGTFKHSEIGYNFKFSDLNAALGLSQFRKLSWVIKKKKFINNYYRKRLSKIKSINFTNPVKNSKPIYWFCTIIVKNRKKLQNFLKNKGIETRDFFYPLHRQKCFNYCSNIKNLDAKFPISDYIYKNGICLPSYPQITKKDLKLVADKIFEFYDYRD